MTPPEQSKLDWKDGVIPVSTQFNDPYFSMNDGLAETRHVFLAGNDLPARLRDGFHIAELGFGTGLNLLALCLLNPAQAIRFTSFEAFPLAAADIARALDHFPQARAIADPFLQQWAAGQTKLTLGNVTAEIILGDARDTLARWQGKADAWFLDGFSPAKNTCRVSASPSFMEKYGSLNCVETGITPSFQSSLLCSGGVICLMP